MEHPAKARRGVNNAGEPMRLHSAPMRLHSIDVEVDPPPDGFEQIENEDRPHVMQIMVAAWRAREEAHLDGVSHRRLVMLGEVVYSRLATTDAYGAGRTSRSQRFCAFATQVTAST